MSCNKETKKCFREKNSIMNDCCKKNLLEILLTINDVFEKHKITYWIDYGTLLGAIRKQSIIPYDDDCDIGILRQDADKLISLSNEFRLLGLHLVTWFYPDFIRIDYSRINELHVDIFIWHFDKIDFKNMWENDDKITKRVCLNRLDFHPEDNIKGKWFPAYYLFPLQKIKLENYEFPCPGNPENFVQFRYGLNWKEETRYE